MASTRHALRTRLLVAAGACVAVGCARDDTRAWYSGLSDGAALPRATDPDSGVGPGPGASDARPAVPDAQTPAPGNGADTGAPGADTGTTNADTGTTTGPNGPNCGVATCNAGEHCCGNLASSTLVGCKATCGSGESIADCRGAMYCGGTTPICCAHLALSGGNRPRCNPTGFDSECANACADEYPTTCTFDSHVRICAAQADCATAAGEATQCCAFGPSPVHWCVPLQIASLGGGSCVP